MWKRVPVVQSKVRLIQDQVQFLFSYFSPKKFFLRKEPPKFLLNKYWSRSLTKTFWFFGYTRFKQTDLFLHLLNPVFNHLTARFLCLHKFRKMQNELSLVITQTFCWGVGSCFHTNKTQQSVKWPAFTKYSKYNTITRRLKWSYMGNINYV